MPWSWSPILGDFLDPPQIALLCQDCEGNIVSLNTNGSSYWGLQTGAGGVRVELLGLNAKGREQDVLKKEQNVQAPREKSPSISEIPKATENTRDVSGV